MKRLLALGLLGLAASTAAAADPLTDLLAANHGFACYDRVYDAAHLAKNPNQKTRTIRLLLTDDPAIGGTTMRVSIRGRDGDRHIVAGCEWNEAPHLDVLGKPYIDTYKAGAGLVCHAAASSDGASAEEGGDFVAELRSADRIVLHLPDGIAAWPSYDTRPEAGFFDFGVDDRVFRVDRTADRLCVEMAERLPSAGDIWGPATDDEAPAVPAMPARP